jgi:uncharacterized repeat protein (TIGR01451 family)
MPLVRPFSLFCFCVALAAQSLCAQTDPDLPGATPNFETIPAGSLIIPMDNTRQSLNGAAFNLKAYGLVNSLLHSNIPVKWAIAAGKRKDETDFIAGATQLLPLSVKLSTARSFTGGPFIIETAYTNRAWSVITNWGNNVSIFKITNDAVIDIRYTLAHKPKVAVMADGSVQFIQTNVLAEAGFSTNDYKVLFATDLPLLSTTSCFTIVTAPHYDGGANVNAQTLAIRGFLNNGGNVLCQCAAVTTYENNATNGHFHTTAGINNIAVNGATLFLNVDCAFNQFIGGVTNLYAGSSLSSWSLRPGSSPTNYAYTTVYVTNATTPYCAVAKLHPNQPGSCMFYLGGHDYGFGTNLTYYNGRRMMMNAIFVPADRPGECAVNFQTDLAVVQDSTIRTYTNGQLVTYTIIATNQGPSRVSSAPFSDIFPANLSNVTWSANYTSTATGSHTNGAGNINETFNIPIRGSVIITATGTLATIDSCTLTNIATISPPSGVIEADATDNTSIHVDATATALALPHTIGCLGTSTTFTASATGLGPFQYAWKKDGAPLANVDSTLTVSNVSATDAGSYTVEVTGGCNSATNTAILFIGDYMTAGQLTNVVACPNDQPVFASTISNVPWATYVWRKNATLIPSATNSALTISVTGVRDAGTYSVEVSSGCVTITNSATLYVPSTAATSIFSLTRCAGQTAAFTTLATGDGPYAYVWRKDGTALSGQTTSALSMTNVATTNTGVYSVEVTGPCNTVTNSATLIVRTNVSLASLGTLFRCPGQTAAFKATPVGTGPFNYHWRKNAILISGQTTSNLVLNSVTANDNGTYTVEITGSCNSATNFGTLAVGVPTTLTPMAAQSHCPTETAVFTTTPTGVGPFDFVWRRDGDVINGETNDTLVIPNLTAGTPPTTITIEVYGACSNATNSTTLRVEDFIYITNSVTFSNTSAIAITDNQPGSIYPSTIHIGCLWPQEVSKIQVGVLGVSHSFPSDICLLLEGPTGKSTPLMINTCGGRDYALTGVDLLFDDDAEAALPFSGQIFNIAYRPTSYDTNVAFPPPAPIYTNIGLSQFANENAHGDWNLYVFDDRIIDSGFIAGGWTLTFFVTEAHAPYFVGSQFDENGVFTTTLHGDAKHTHVIEVSTDLSTWTAIATNDLPTGTFIYTDGAPSTLLFYRALRLP